MWSKWSHVLQPLTTITPRKEKFKWTVVKQKSFYEIKQIVDRDTLLIHPDINKCFDVHMDASKFRLESVISQ